MQIRTGVVKRAACVVAAVIGLVFNSAPALAQSEATVRGRAIAAADGSALSQASITLTPAGGGAAVQTAADADGVFVFSHVRPGTYVLAGASNGFQTRELPFTVEPRETRNVTLALDITRLAVEVNVSGVPAPSTHSPSSTLLTSERIDALPPAQQLNLPEAIVTAAPGMIRGHDDFVHVRGHEVALNPVINGVSFWENPHALFSSGLPPGVIETANVMTGGFPAEYGNRFGGVVDIVTKSGLGMRHEGAVAFTGGEAGRRSGTGEFGGRRNTIGYYAFGSLFASDRYLSPPDPVAIHDEGRGGHVFVQVDANLGDAGLLRAVAMGSGTNAQIPKTPLDVELRPLANADQRTRQETAILGWTRSSSTAALGVSGYQRWSSARLAPAEGPLTASAAFDRTLQTLGVKADLTRFAGRHTVKAGADLVSLRPDEELTYNYNGYRELTHLLGLPHIHIAGNQIAFADSRTGGQVSAYVQDGIQLGSAITADVGVRLDHYDLVVSATHASPRVNVAARVGGGAVLHASYNHFFVPPPIEGVLSSSAGLTANIAEIGVALPPLEPTTEDQFEVGASAPVGPLSLALTGYYRRTDNPVHTTVWPDARIYSYASFDRERAYGLEVKAEAPMLARYGVTGYLNYALGRVTFYNPVTGGFITEAEHLNETNGFPAPMDQTHTFTGGLTYRPGRGSLWMGAMVEYGSGTPIGHGAAHEHGAAEADHEDAAASDGATRVPGHTTGNVSVGFDLLRDGNRRPRLTLRVDVENVADNLYLIAQESQFSPSQYSIPRLVSATARIRF